MVLAVKSCFYDDEMRRLMIKKTEDKVNYHDRRCCDLIVYMGPQCSRISTICKTWFNSLGGKDDVANVTIDRDIMEDIENCDNGNIENFDNESRGPPSPLENQLKPEISMREDVKVEYGDDLNVSRSVSVEDDQDWTEDPKTYSCDMCDISFHLKGSLNKHKGRMHKCVLKTDQSEGNFQCEDCDRKFRKLSSLRKHMTRKHSSSGMKTEFESEDDNKRIGYSCDTEGCDDLIFNKKHEYKNHMKSVHNLPRKGRRPKEPMDESLMEKLGLDLNIKENECPQSCEYCGKVYGTKLKLYWHHKRVHQMKHRPCHLCGLMVKKLSDHIKRQHTEKDIKKFVCEFCGDRFKGQSGYQFHIAGHTGEKKYHCRSCAKTFRTSSEAYNCERGHQGIFKWNCDLCSFKSHQRNKYVRHLRTHSKSQPFSCPLCDHRAARKDYMQKHVIKAHTSTHTENVITLEQIEALHPKMYNIDEKIDLPTPPSYIKLNLVEASTLGEETIHIQSNTQETEPIENTHLLLCGILPREASLLKREEIQSSINHESLQRISLPFLDGELLKRSDHSSSSILHRFEKDDVSMTKADQEPGLVQDHLESLVVAHPFLHREVLATNFLQRHVEAGNSSQQK